MANLVVARKKTKGRGGLIFVCCCHVFWFEKDVTGRNFGLEHSICSFVFGLFGNADGITGIQCLIW